MITVLMLTSQRHIRSSVISIAARSSINGVTRTKNKQKEQQKEKEDSYTSRVAHVGSGGGQKQQQRYSRRNGSILEFPGTPYSGPSNGGGGGAGAVSQLLETETDPRKFLHKMDLMLELSNNSASYQTWEDERESIDIYGWNNLITDYLEKIRSRVAINRNNLDRGNLANNPGSPGRNSKPGLDPSISCCIHNGADILLHHQSITRIHKIRELSRSLKGVGISTGQLSRSQWTVFKSLAGEAERYAAETSSPGIKAKRKWCTVPPETKNLILQLTQMTGLSISNITLISIQIVLCTQIDLDIWDADNMANVVSEFLKTTDARAEACEVLMERWLKK